MRLPEFVVPRAWRMIVVVVLTTIGFSACGEESSFDAQTVAAATRIAKQKKHSDRSPFGQNAADYELTFSEEFDSLNRSVWNDHIWYEEPHPIKNYAVEDGVLKIWPHRDASGKFFNRTLDTDGKFEQKYGYFEMEARLPRGKGTWPGFWLLARPGNRRPEIDIMEAYAGGVEPWGRPDHAGVSRPTAYGVTVWHDEGIAAGQLQFDVGKDLSTDFHKYAVKWEPHRQTFYFDGKRIHTVDAHIADAMYILLDLWFGSSSGDPDESTPQGKSNAFEVRYVRAWRFRHQGVLD